MHYGRKRAIIIASIIIGVLLILGIGGTILYLKTDIFKSNQSQNKNNNNKVLIKKEEFSNNILTIGLVSKSGNYKFKFKKS